MLLKYYLKKITKFGLFSSILFGLFTYPNFGEPYQAFASTSEEQPTDISIINPEGKIDYKRSNKYFGLGIGYAIRGELETAIEYFDKAIAFNTENASAYANRGNIYLQQSQWDKALADYDRALEIYPKLSGRTYYNRGSIYDMRGNWDQALADYNMAIELKSHFYAAYFQRGNLHLRQENWLDAIEDFEQAIELEPNKEQGYFGAGFGYLNMREWDKAFEKYNQGIIINPNDGDAYFSRGFIHVYHGRKARAIRDWKQAKKIFLEQKDLASQQKVEKFLELLDDSFNNFDQDLFYL